MFQNETKQVQRTCNGERAQTATEHIDALDTAYNKRAVSSARKHVRSLHTTTDASIHKLTS